MAYLRILQLPISLVLLACGSPSGDDRENAETDGAGGGELQEMTPTGGSENGGAGTGGMGTGGTGTGSASMTGGTSSDGDTVPSDLYPMAVGNTWTYAATEKVVGGCPEEQRTISYEEEEFFDGRDSFVGTVVCAIGYTARQAIRGDIIEQYSENRGDWFVSYQTPLQDGFEWSPFEGTTLRWEEVGTFTVPAGTFDNCWDRVIVGTVSRNTYCAEVGMIRGETAEYIVELESYSLVR